MVRYCTYLQHKADISWSACCGAAEMNLTSTYKDTGSIPGIAQWLRGSAIWHCRELWFRSQMPLRSPVAVAAAIAPIQPLAWEHPYVSGVALKGKKRKKKLIALMDSLHI